MSPYIWFAVAMAGIIVVSLLLTGNLAAKFNQRAKSDLAAALDPLATAIDGEKEVESATVRGVYSGHYVTARVSSGPGGMARLFETTMTVPGAGETWSAVVRRPRGEVGELECTFEGSSALDPAVASSVHPRLEQLLPFPGWFELKRDSVSGTLTLTRAMQSRRDLPTLERFLAYLDTLAAVAAEELARGGQVAGEAAVAVGSPTKS